MHINPQQIYYYLLFEWRLIKSTVVVCFTKKRLKKSNYIWTLERLPVFKTTQQRDHATQSHALLVIPPWSDVFRSLWPVCYKVLHVNGWCMFYVTFEKNIHGDDNKIVKCRLYCVMECSCRYTNTSCVISFTWTWMTHICSRCLINIWYDENVKSLNWRYSYSAKKI